MTGRLKVEALLSLLKTSPTVQALDCARKRAQRAHIVIRREHVEQTGNDMGWECMFRG